MTGDSEGAVSGAMATAVQSDCGSRLLCGGKGSQSHQKSPGGRHMIGVGTVQRAAHSGTPCSSSSSSASAPRGVKGPRPPNPGDQARTHGIAVAIAIGVNVSVSASCELHRRRKSWRPENMPPPTWDPCFAARCAVTHERSTLRFGAAPAAVAGFVRIAGRHGTLAWDSPS
jgi:hypothetical protein